MSTNPKDTFTHPYPPLFTHKKCPPTPTQPKYISTYPQPPIKMSTHSCPPKIYLHLATYLKYTSTYTQPPPLTHKKCPATPIYLRNTPINPHPPMSNNHSHKIYLHLPTSMENIHLPILANLQKICSPSPIQSKYTSRHPTYYKKFPLTPNHPKITFS